MPVSMMEATEAEKIHLKTSELEATAKVPKSIMDYFKTPEKEVATKQKSLFQYFSKTQKLSTSETSSTEKENVCVENDPTQNNTSSNLSDSEKKPSTRAKENVKITNNLSKSEEMQTEDNANLQESVKKKLKLKKKQVTSNDQESCESNPNLEVTEEQHPLENESEDSIILVSDVSNIDEDLIEKPVTNELKEDSVVKSLVKNDEQNKESSDNNEMNTRPTSEELISKDESASPCLNDCGEDITLLSKQHEDEAVNKSSLSGSARKPALKGKEMMSLLMEIKGTKEGKKSKHKHHKHKHRHREKSEKDNSQNKIIGSCPTDDSNQTEAKDEQSSDFQSEKDEFKKPVTTCRPGSKVNKVCTNSLQVENDTESLNNSKPQTASLVSENKIKSSMTETTDEKVLIKITDQEGNRGDTEVKKNENVAVTKKKKSKKSKELKKSIKDHEQIKQIVKEETDSDTKSISYEDFLKNIETEVKEDTVKSTATKEMSYSDYVKSLEIKDSLEEPMEISINDSGDNESNRTLKENETDQNVQNSITLNDKSNQPDSKTGENQTADDNKSDLSLPSKPTGIARFFNVITSTPDKPKKLDADCHPTLSSPKATNKTKKKVKASKKACENIKDVNNVNVLSTEISLTQTKQDEIEPILEQSDNEQKSKEMECIAPRNEDIEKVDEEKRRKKLEFLNSKSSLNTSVKKTQAVLNFNNNGLTMVKQDSVDIEDITCVSGADNVMTKTPQKAKKKSSNSKSGVAKSNDKLLSDDSNVFETPKNKARGRKSKVNVVSDEHPSESDISSESLQTDESGDGNRRRSLRKKYRVSVFQMDEDRNTPIKIKLRRCPKSNSNLDEGDMAAAKAKKLKEYHQSLNSLDPYQTKQSVEPDLGPNCLQRLLADDKSRQVRSSQTKQAFRLTAKQSKAQALLDKAKKSKKKSKVKTDEMEIEKTKKEKKSKKKSKRKSKDDSGEEVVEHRRSSRLEGRTMPSMEEVSLENIVILSDEEEEYKAKHKKKKDKKIEKLFRNKDEKSTKNKDEKSTKNKEEKSTKDKNEKSTKDKNEKTTKDKNEKTTKDKNEKSIKNKEEKSVKKKDEPMINKDVYELAVKGSPKTKGKRTASPAKSAGKLAPIFMGKGSKPPEVKKPLLDPEQAKQRMSFLMSGVPEELRKHTAKVVAAAVAVDYPPIPTVSHILQAPVEDSFRPSSPGLVDVWQLKKPELNLRRYVEPFCLEPMSRFTGDLINRQMANVDLTLIKNFKELPMIVGTVEEACIAENFKEHPVIEGMAEEACIAEVSCYNPSFPVAKLFTSLKKLKKASEQIQLETGSEVKPVEPDVVTVIDDDEPQPKKKGKRSRLKLQKEEKTDVRQIEPSKPLETTNKPGNSLLWTDKYQPSSSAEVIGNSGSVKKLKSWLSEWKHVLDREAKKARKQLMKKNKGKLQKTEVADDQWDSDSDFDMDSEDSDIEDTLCNTMLITGPHGCGKTAAVYALAQEQGFKVHEVNASSSRNGKKILSQLQEATQSHQVSHQGVGTPSKNSSSQGASKPKPATMPTAFTNLFKKKDTTTDASKQIDDKKSKKRKRDASEQDENPKKKRSKKEDKKKMLKPTFLDIDESSNGMVQGLNLSSTTMILFDEVDLVFDDDKGFLSAIQTFMATTKVPIVMTTTNPMFTYSFDGRYESLTFKQPSVSSLSSYLQLICLLEGVRVDPATLSELIQVFKCDVRGCLLSLQFLSTSGGSLAQTFKSVAKPSAAATKQLAPTVDETIESSQDSQHSTQGNQNPNFGDDDDDDFVMLKPRTIRQKRLLDDDNSNSMEPFAQVYSKSTELVIADSKDDDGKTYPCVHRMGMDHLLGLALGTRESMHETFLRNLKMPTITNLLETFHICDVCHTFCQNLLYNNHILLLPLVTKVTDHVTSSVRQEQHQRKSKKRKRIQNDLYDSEASNDAVDCTNPVDSQEEYLEKEEIKPDTSPYQKRENMCNVKTLSAFSRFYDSIGMLDMLATNESLQVMNSVRTTCGRKIHGSIQPGLADDLPKFQNLCDADSKLRHYSTEVEARSVSKFYQEVDRLQGEVEDLCRNNPAYSEDYILPVVRGTEKFTLLNKNEPSQGSSVKRAEDNVVQNLPLVVHNHHRQLNLDYLPTLREISRTEHHRQIANTKRRFHHYFDSIALPLKDTTMNILTSTLS